MFGITNRFESPYLQVLDERNFVRGSNDVLGDTKILLGVTFDTPGEHW
jgi:hypothetical protein